MKISLLPFSMHVITDIGCKGNLLLNRMVGNHVIVVEISSTTGIMVDPVYNIKAIRGMLHEMKYNPGRFKGHEILYIHIGE